jgi:hypothetical protein
MPLFLPGIEEVEGRGMGWRGEGGGGAMWEK